MTATAWLGAVLGLGITLVSLAARRWPHRNQGDHQ